MQIKSLARALNNAGFATFTDKTYSSHKRNAQLNLEGRTHYTDDRTLAYFHSRILTTSDTAEGLIFWIIESVALDSENTKRGFRYVAFDVFGTVLDRVRLDESFSTKEKARSAFNTWFSSFDVLGHYSAALESKAKQADKQAAEFRAMLES